ncbi:dihydrodipicolinate reductase [Sinanaerobacter chloroacetimidivorans]|uniref:Dihydrodipicolinate reductase n=1 Tax=Sinanaerobacter chloroacetimidivorans TaxID=2818044 RepID=A0A8J7VZ53_9FIRM|nr:dihydrodipicolinate reductase [Sinanaerobacter chloroacetimidivorans]MBR0597394.1 dihydrodipicolinate reductase [Sinanaerobacter chloroacetimidivorans]
MDRKVKIVQYGCGKMSVYLMRYAMEKGGELVAAFDANPGVIGRDIGEIIGTAPLGIKVTDAAKADEVLKQTKPDVCIIATRSTMAELKEAFALCAKNGVNAISTCEEALFPWNSSPDITRELDELAKAGGCTLCGSGYPDLFWGTMVTNLAGSSVSITKIKGSSSYNVEDYGIALAKGHGAGLTIEEFHREIGNYNSLSSDEIKELVIKGAYIPSYMWNQNGWLCSRLGLTILSQTQKCVPHTYQSDLHSSTLDMTIKAGDATGMSAIVTTETAEGITLETECIGKVYAPDEYDKNEWTLFGEPETTVIVNRPATVELTCGTIVNRIPQLIDSPPGYITTDKMPDNAYMARPMHEYVKSR